jgi:hypothetical protein
MLEMETVPLLTKNTREQPFPLTVSPVEPLPSMVRFWEMTGSSEFRVIVLFAGRLKAIVSPGFAAPSAARKVPAPLSAADVTVIVAARPPRAQSNQIDPQSTLFRNPLLEKCLAGLLVDLVGATARHSITLAFRQPDFSSQAYCPVAVRFTVLHQSVLTGIPYDLLG